MNQTFIYWYLLTVFPTRLVSKSQCKYYHNLGELALNTLRRTSTYLTSVAGCVCVFVFVLTLKMFRKCCWFKLAVWVLCPPHPPTEATLHDPRPLNCSRELTSATPWESISIICLGLRLMGASSDWAEQNGGIQKPDPFYWVQLLTTVIPECFPMSSSRQRLRTWIEVKGLLNLFGAISSRTI